MTTLTIMIGIPGSGKSTYTKTKMDRKVKILSSDAIRKELFLDEENQENNILVFNTLHERAREFLLEGKDVVIDATNTNIEDRTKTLLPYKDLDIKRKAIIVQTPVETCVERDKRRRRVVGEDVINEYLNNYTPPTKEEGFDEIVVVKNTDDGFMRFMQTTLLVIIKDEKIMLARKKRGFGAGLYNGVGGKVEFGETVEDAMIREAYEEASITPKNYKKRAIIDFDEFVKDERTHVNMHIYVASDYEGTPTESNEMIPVWFDLNKIPFSRMFPDDSHWLPEILKGNNVKAFFKYDINLNILEKKIEVINDDLI